MVANLARGPLADRVTHHIESPTYGNFQLFQVKAVTATDNDTGELVANGAGIMGATFASGGWTFSIEVHRQVGIPDEVGWHNLKTSGPGGSRERFVYAMQDIGGTRRQWINCQVVKTDIAAPADGNQTMTIEVLAPEMIEILPEAA